MELELGKLYMARDGSGPYEVKYENGWWAVKLLEDTNWTGRSATGYYYNGTSSHDLVAEYMPKPVTEVAFRNVYKQGTYNYDFFDHETLEKARYARKSSIEKVGAAWLRTLKITTEVIDQA